MSQVNRLRKELEQTTRELQQALAQNEMYKDYIESLLEYNNKLVTIIEKQLKVNTKVESNLQPISQRTENDSQMVDNRSLSMRAVKVSGGSVLLTSNNMQTQSQKQRKDSRSIAARLERIQEEADSPPAAPVKTETYESELYRQIYNLLDTYNEQFFSKRQLYSNMFRSMINELEEDRQMYGETHEKNLQILDIKCRQLNELLKEVRVFDGSAVISRISEKNKKVAGEIASIIDKRQN